jgi:hypothetical protein
MKRLNSNRMKLVLLGIVAGIVFGIGQARADFTFGTPTNLGPPISTPYDDSPPYISPDGLEMYLGYLNMPGGYGDWDIWVRTRKTVNDDWGDPVNLGSPVNTGQSDVGAQLSSDGLEMTFISYNRSGGYGGWDIWVTRRVTKEDPWGQPTNLGSMINSSATDYGPPNISSDELELYFTSNRPGGVGSEDIWVSRRATKDHPWGEPVNLGSVVNSSASEAVISLSSDGLILFFSGELNHPIRSGGMGDIDIWMTRRTSISDPWGIPVNLGPIVNSPSRDVLPGISRDGSTLYFSSMRPGGLGGANFGDVYQAPILPIVDFNGDRIVDAEDMCIMVDHWGEDYPLCDIGPMPWGDGIVDVEDLIVLAEHLFEQLPGRPINP